MNAARLKTRRVVTAFGMLGFSVLCYGASGCGTSDGSTPTCSRIGGIGGLATLNLSCPESGLSMVAISEPCADDSLSATLNPTQYAGKSQIFIESHRAGVCHVALTFASGFGYATDVTFTSSTSGCGTLTVAPTQTTFRVEIPTSDCADAGSAGSGG